MRCAGEGGECAVGDTQYAMGGANALWASAMGEENVLDSIHYRKVSFSATIPSPPPSPGAAGAISLSAISLNLRVSASAVLSRLAQHFLASLPDFL